MALKPRVARKNRESTFDVALDLETWGLGGPVALWCMVDGAGGRYSGTKVGQILPTLQTIASSREGGNGSKSLTIWAHNGGGYDYLLMFPEHPFSVFEDGGLWVESKLLLGLIRLNRRQCLRFRDTLSLFPSTTLAELGHR